MKGRLLNLASAALALTTAISTVAAPVMAAEDDSVHEIRTVEDLIAIGASEDTLTWNYKLCADLDLGDYNWKPIGADLVKTETNEYGYSYENGGVFSGTLDGNGHSILNMTQKDQTQPGLFYKILSYSNKIPIQNLSIKDVDISYDGDDRVQGGVLSDRCGSFSGVYVSGSVSLKAPSIGFGGICENAGMIAGMGWVLENGKSDLNIYAELKEKSSDSSYSNYTNNVGGCLGYVYYQSVSNFTFNGSILVDNFSFGYVNGVAIRAYGASNLTNNGDITVHSKGGDDIFSSVGGVLCNMNYISPEEQENLELELGTPQYSNLVNTGNITHTYENNHSAPTRERTYSAGWLEYSLETGGVAASASIFETHYQIPDININIDYSLDPTQCH